jgi:tyrosyl-tRNA synthetase
MLTELSREEIEALDKSRADEPHRRASQQRLAEELTRLVHGDSGLQTARRATEVFFGAEIDDLTDRQLMEIFADVPSRELPKSRLTSEGIGIVDALVEAELAKSKGEARRTVQQGGAYVNNRRCNDIDTRLTPEHLAGDSVLVLRSGKKRYGLLRFVE